MNKKQYEARRTALMNEAQELIDQGKTTEAEEKMNEVRQLDELWDSISQSQANLNALIQDPKPMNVFGQNPELMNFGLPQGDTEKPDTAEAAWASGVYTNAWAKKLTGRNLTDEEQNVFQMVNAAYTHTTENTAVVIPKTVTKGIWETAAELYPYYGDVAKTYVNGVLTMIQGESSSEAGWYEEEAETEDGKELFKEFTLSGCELSRAITVSWKLKEMAIEDFIPYIQRKMGEKMGAALGYGATHGKGNATAEKPEPIGVVTALEKEDSTPQVVTYTGDAPTFKNLTEARSKVKSAYANGLFVYANSTTIWTKLANIVDTNKRPIFMPDPSGNGVFRIFGMVVKEDASMLDGEVLISNPAAGYHMNVNKEMTMIPEEHVKARKTDYCGYAIVDGNAVTTKAHALLKMGE